MFELLEDLVDFTADAAEGAIELGADVVKAPMEILDDLFDDI